MKNNIMMTIIVAVIVGAVAFFAGTKYAGSQNTSTGQFGQNGGQRTGRFGQNGGQGARATFGQVLSQDAGSITIKLQDGSSKIVNVTDSTTYTKTDKATKNDVAVSQTIAAFGATNSDGSINAQDIQLNPSFRQGQGRGSNTMPPQNQAQ